MFKPTADQIKEAQGIVARETPISVGYRLIIKPLPWNNTLKAGEASKYEFLAKAGFEAQSSTQTERENRGSHVGIVCHVGDCAYDERLGGKAWANEGDVVVFNRYAGQRVDLPPGSEDFYHFCNDEDLLGKYEVTA